MSHSKVLGLEVRTSICKSGGGSANQPITALSSSCGVLTNQKSNKKGADRGLDITFIADKSLNLCESKGPQERGFTTQTPTSVGVRGCQGKI